jgi:amino acid adenylation domain-containing protein/non-ribosomal peptide synthase protein (TIGR01720 family)
MAEHFVFPMSAAQKQLWFLDQLQPGDAFYNLSGVVRLDGPLDEKALEQSLHALVERHESLRTTFAMVEQQPSQLIASELALPFHRVELTELAPAERTQALERLIEKEARTGFELSQGPLIRTTLVRLDAQANVLLVTMHHIISDGWSLGVFSQELAAFYEAATTQAPHGLPELSIQYADFACWQNERLASLELAADLDYWRARMKDTPALIELPTDMPRPAMQTFHGRSVTFQIERPLVQELEALGRANGNATLFMVLLSAFGALLHRYTGQRTVVVGSPVAGRSRPETESLIGLFINTLPLRLDVDGRRGFHELLASVRDTVLGALAHQEVPFATMVDALQPVRNPSYNPLFQVLFVFQNTPQAPRKLRGLSVAMEERSTSAKFDLTLEVTPHASGLQVRWEYNTALFEEATARRMAAHYTQLLHALSTAPRTPVADARMLAPEEREELLRTWNATGKPRRAPRLLHALIEEQAALRPGDVALVEENVSLTYEEMNARANQVAHYLRARGIGLEHVVGVHAPKTWRGVVAMLGILKAGAVYLPLEPTYPAERRAYMLEDSDCRLVLRAGGPLEPASVPGLSLDEEWPRITRESTRAPEVDVTEEHLAYVIYTSGTTGRPKGVAVTHRGIHNLGLAQIQAFDVTPGSRVLQFASWGFDASVSEFAMALGSGAALHLLGDADVTTLGLNLLELMRQQAITHVTLPPSLLSVLPSTELPALRGLIVAGERCPAELVTRWGSGRSFFNAYGPTESSVCATLTARTLAHGRVSIGRAIDNITLYVLDAHMNPVPVGVRGELYIGGVGLARGYVGQPALSAERFVPNPHATEPGERLYRTGDMVRYLPGGDIEFLGRGDGQLKIRGHRVEVGEVEEVLRGYPGVRETAVVDVEGPTGGMRLAAFVVPESGRHVTASGLGAFLNERLPAYMRPSSFHFLENALPLTAHGKVARGELRALAAAQAELPRQDMVAARDSVEERLVRVFRAVLNRQEVSIRDNFFDLGGDSIRSIQVSAQAKQEGLLVTPRQLLQHQTIEQLAPHVQQLAARAPASERAEGTSRPTPIQRWFFEDTTAGLHHFNQSLLLEVPAELTAELLTDALERLSLHHEVLRSRFRRDGAQWLQAYSEEHAAPAVSAKDVSALAPQERDEAMMQAVQAAQTSLDIEKGPVLQAVLFQRGAGQPHLLLLAAHHLVVDAVSWRILAEDLDTVTRQLQRGEAVVLPPRTATFQQWAGLVEELMQTEAAREELAYWERLARTPPPRLPVELSHGDNTYGAAHSIVASLDAQVTAQLLNEAPKAHRATVQEILLSALVGTVSAWARTPRVLLEIESQGRESAGEGLDVSRTVGWFTTVHPLLLQVERTEPGLLLQSVKEQFRRVPRGGSHYLALRQLGIDADSRERLRAVPTPEIGFNYLGEMAVEEKREPSRFRFSEQQYSDLDVAPERRRSHLWDLGVSVQHGRLLVEWVYCPHVHSSETMSGLMRSFLDAVKECVREGLQPSARSTLTPSDFPKARLSQGALDAFLKGLTKG